MKLGTLRSALASSALLLGVILIGNAAPVTAQNEPPGQLPKVNFSYDNISPRQIEDLTSRSVPRDYALAWQTLANALSSNRSQRLDAYFTGFAREDVSTRIKDQQSAGIHVQYVDHGHKLKALFYSPAGDAMQLRDQAQLEIEVFDGGNLLKRDSLNVEYMVLMTPGADRWLVRDIQAIPEEKR